MKRFALFVAVVFAILLAFLLTWRLFEIVLMFVASLALAAALRAPIERLADLRIPRGVAIIIVYAGVALGLAVLLIVLYQRLGNELATLPEDLGLLYARLAGKIRVLSSYSPPISTRFPTPEEMSELLVSGGLGSAARPVLGFTQNLTTALGNLSLIIILSVYWTADRLRFERLALSLAPARSRGHARNIWRSVETGLGRYLRSELFQSFLAGLVLAPVFSLLGVRYPVFWALAASLAWLVPLVGAFIVIVPMWLVLWLQSGVLVASIAVLVTLIALAVLEFVVERKLYYRERGMNVLLLVVILVMADAYGLLGLLVAPPIALAIHIILSELANPEAVVLTTPQPKPATDVAALETELERVRELVAGTENGARLRLESLTARLEGLLREAKEI